MSYPGNASLAEEIREKILSTFDHTLDLAAAGKREEALLGCDFIRRLDPEFGPAQVLQERIESQGAPVPVDDLRISTVTEEPAAVLTPIEPPTSEAPAVETPPSETTAPTAPAGEPEIESPVAAESDSTALLESALDLSALDQTPEAEAPAEDADVPPDAAPEAAAPPPSGEAPPEDVLQAPATDELEAQPEVPAEDLEPAPESDADDTSLLESALDLSTLSQEPEAEEAEPEPEAEEAEPEPEGEPAAALDQESEERVGQLLEEGQQAFDKAEYQSAIDAWSRIFLIDIDHPEANRRIELARKLKAEVERKVEETYHEALTAMETGSLEVARERFEAVLNLQPNHLSAQEHLDRLSAGDFIPEPEEEELPPLGEVEPTEMPPPEPEEISEELLDSDFEMEPMPEHEPGQMYEPAEAAAPVKRAAGRRPVAVIAALVFVVALAGAWFLYSNRDRFFPNAGEEVVAPQPPRVDPIVRAQGLHLAGNTSMAISQLRRLPPAHPQYAEAQALIAQWETVLEGDEAEGPSEEQLEERDRLVAMAREAFANREFLAAEEFFTLASQVAPLDEGTRALQTETVDRLAPLRSEIEIFRQGEWGHALRNLWRKHEEDPQNPDILTLMVDSYVNLAVRDLQRGDPRAAAESLAEAASLASSDPEIQRLQEFAATYSDRPPDLLYRIFVKYLPFR